MNKNTFEMYRTRSFTNVPMFGSVFEKRLRTTLKKFLYNLSNRFADIA